MEAVLRTFREAGFSPNLTHHAYHAIDSHITGFTLWQVGMPFRTHEELVDLADGFLRKIPADEFPYVVEHAEQLRRRRLLRPPYRPRRARPPRRPLLPPRLRSHRSQ